MSCRLLRVMNYFRPLIEINNEPVKNIIALEKGTAQNLTCNRWSQFVPIQWLKVNLSLFSVVYYLSINLNGQISIRMESYTPAKSTRTNLRYSLIVLF